VKEKEIQNLRRWCGGCPWHFDFATAAVEREFELPGALSSLCAVTKGYPGTSQSQIRRIKVDRCEKLRRKTCTLEGRQLEPRSDRELEFTLDGRLHGSQLSIRLTHVANVTLSNGRIERFYSSSGNYDTISGVLGYPSHLVLTTGFVYTTKQSHKCRVIFA
jgi:hypothetical protein